MRIWNSARSIVFVLIITSGCWSMALDETDGASDLTIKNYGALAFGPENVLFIGDSMSAAIFAVTLSDAKVDAPVSDLVLKNIDEKVAQALGTTPKDVRFNDLVVNPVSQKAYFSVTRGSGEKAVSLLMSYSVENQLEVVPVEKLDRTRFNLKNPISMEAERRGRPQRGDAITNLVFHEGELYVAGLSNEEFASTFRKIPYPFNKAQTMTSLEVYHVAHEALETHAPIRAFHPVIIDGKPHLLAAYTCTPLVTFPMDAIEDGKHLKGKTVAELGAGNRPLDLLPFSFDGKEYVLISNNRRGVMRVSMSDLDAQNKKEGLDGGVEAWGTKGVSYVTLPFSNVQHLTNLNQNMVSIIYMDAQGETHLDTLSYKIIMGIFN